MNRDLEVIQELLVFQDKLVLKVNKDHKVYKVYKVLLVLRVIKVIHLFIQTLLLNS